MGKRIVKNYPSPRLMETIGATNQKPAEAIGELVANSFDARIGTEKIKIVIDLQGDRIQVIDNGKGMTFDVLEKAVCIAEDMSKHIERGEGAKGYFGMGFKTSCSTLGYNYEIFTRPKDENLEYHVSFDIKGYSNRPSGADAWDVEIDEELPNSSSPLKNMKCGTAFVISRLKVDLVNIGAILKYLGNAFKGHIENGDVIAVIDKKGVERRAEPAPYNLIENTKIDIDINFIFGDKEYSIEGWVGLDKQTNNDTHYGFNIYRRNQLVESWNKDWFKSHLMTSRIKGEVNMDFLDATFYKQGTQQSELWEIASKNMKEFLKKGVVKASRDVSRKGNVNNPTELRRIVSELNTNYDNETNTIDNGDTDGNQNGKKGKEPPTSINDDIKNIVKEQELILKDQKKIEITYLQKDKSGNVHSPFDYIYSESMDDDENSELQVITYKNHPLWNKKIDSEAIQILATSDSIYRMLVEKLSFESNEASNIRNEWVNNRVGTKKCSSQVKL